MTMSCKQDFQSRHWQVAVVLDAERAVKRTFAGNNGHAACAWARASARQTIELQKPNKGKQYAEYAIGGQYQGWPVQAKQVIQIKIPHNSKAHMWE